MTWDWNFAIQIFPEIAGAIWLVIGITFGAYIVSLVLGLVLTFARRSNFKPLSLITYCFIEFVRSTPPLVQLFFVFFALPSIGISLDKYTAGILTLGIHYSTYLSEVYRSGIDSIPKGQWEAAKALNFTKMQTWSRVILPQAIPPVIPMMGNYLLVLFKETPLLMAIGVGEFLQKAQLIGAEYFKYLEPITITGILFLLLSYPSAVLINKLEKRSKLAFKSKRLERVKTFGDRGTGIHEKTS
ncbi:amino acid ABC transporter membrane protein 2 (PAAT family) [Bacillus oleivorans]|uniref:Amino acid ABC transporter membrane protein 2 (PAAT family) n=1 Tax=Bacillus oleivorans TaxID=1448271 RepID=A0A285D474_9BACI|nr:ectoine/hydroxyectoine ABC transporter permease subunit EhuD [Bacillus oleivorans]SNX74116.1 amino acid ABC transporter membrane protein 2 (PAAT family) [Bacillus oleivorans]